MNYPTPVELSVKKRSLTILQVAEALAIPDRHAIMVLAWLVALGVSNPPPKENNLLDASWQSKPIPYVIGLWSELLRTTWSGKRDLLALALDFPRDWQRSIKKFEPPYLLADYVYPEIPVPSHWTPQERDLMAEGASHLYIRPEIGVLLGLVVTQQVGTTVRYYKIKPAASVGWARKSSVRLQRHLYTPPEVGRLIAIRSTKSGFRYYGNGHERVLDKLREV